MNLVNEGVLPPNELDDRDERLELQELREIERPRNCGECVRFFRDKDDPNKGYCDEWPCVLTPDCVCHPNIGWKRKAKEGDAK